MWDSFLPPDHYLLCAREPPQICRLGWMPDPHSLLDQPMIDLNEVNVRGVHVLQLTPPWNMTILLAEVCWRQGWGETLEQSTLETYDLLDTCQDSSISQLINVKRVWLWSNMEIEWHNKTMSCDIVYWLELAPTHIYAIYSYDEGLLMSVNNTPRSYSVQH